MLLSQKRSSEPSLCVRRASSARLLRFPVGEHRSWVTFAFAPTYRLPAHGGAEARQRSDVVCAHFLPADWSAQWCYSWRFPYAIQMNEVASAPRQSLAPICPLRQSAPMSPSRRRPPVTRTHPALLHLELQVGKECLPVHAPTKTSL